MRAYYIFLRRLIRRNLATTVFFEVAFLAILSFGMMVIGPSKNNDSVANLVKNTSNTAHRLTSSSKADAATVQTTQNAATGQGATISSTASSQVSKPQVSSKGSPRTGAPLTSIVTPIGHSLVFSPSTITIPSDSMGENFMISTADGAKVLTPTISYNPLILNLFGGTYPNGPQSSYHMNIGRSYVQAAGSAYVTVTAKTTGGVTYTGELFVNYPATNYISCVQGTNSSSDDGHNTTYSATFTMVPHGNLIGAHLRYGLGAASIGIAGGNNSETVVYNGQNDISLTVIITDNTLKGIQSGFYMHDTITSLDSWAMGGCNIQYWVDNPY